MIDCITYGRDRFDLLKFNPIKNNHWVKPLGGLWASPIDTEWGWREWCESENFHIKQLSEFFEFTLYGDVYVIDSLEDLKNLPIQKNDYRTYVDFEKVIDRYDALWLTYRGQIETRMTDPDLYGWDCESILIFSPECIFPKEKKNDRKKRYS